MLAPGPAMALLLLSAGGALAALALVAWALFRRGGPFGQRAMARLIADETGAAVVTDPIGRVLLATGAARHRWPLARGQPLQFGLTALFADPARAVADLLDDAARDSAAQRLAHGPAGAVRVTVTRAALRAYLWRFEGGEAEGAPTALPMLRVTRGGMVLSANPATRALFARMPRTLADLGLGDLPAGCDITVEIATPVGPILRRILRLAVDPETEEIYLLPPEPPDSAAQGAPDAVTALLDALPVALVQLGRDGAIHLANARARALLGLASGEAGNLCDLLEGLGRPVRDWLAAAAEGRTAHPAEVLRAARPTCETYLRVTLTPHRGGGLVAVLDDVTEMKTLEAQFAQSQKMQAIGQLAGGVAHDFNNLLTAISGHCDLLMLRHDAGDPDYGDLVQIHQNANRAASLVAQLLAFSRKQTLRPQVLDLPDVLAELGHLLDRLVGDKVRLRMRHAPGLPPVRADKRQLEQVVMNLVVNARDAMPAGGEILIECALLTVPAPWRRDKAVVPPGRYAVIHVRDEGAGIPPDKLPKIFEPFFTTKRPGEGTGLGLSTAYGIVKQTGGFIFAESAVGEGSCFSIYLPAHAGEAAAPPAPAAPAPEEPAAGGVVLLVEDEAPVRAFAARALRLKGHTVLEAACGQDALDLLEEDDLQPDLLITDMVMPEIDGPTLAAEVRFRRPGLPVLFISGHAEEAAGEARARIEGAEFLQKPFSLDSLAATVQRAIGSGPR
ncbi:hypothetical protein CKO19_08060 [Rhodovulum adriaticum]|nr:hypothetical protein [Rhodovulum adriaticum]